MFRIITENGRFEIEQPELELRLIELELQANALAKAEQEALMRVYVFGQLTEEQRAGGVSLLTERLGRCERTVRKLLQQGRLHYTAVGKKGYVVTEYDVRRLLGIPVHALPAPTAGAKEIALSTKRGHRSSTPVASLQ